MALLQVRIGGKTAVAGRNGTRSAGSPRNGLAQALARCRPARESLVANDRVEITK